MEEAEKKERSIRQMVVGKSNQEKIKIRQIRPADKSWVKRILTQYWGSAKIISRGRLHWADKLPGFVAELNGKKVGLITYEIKNNECEIVSLNSEEQKKGVGTALLEKVKKVAKKSRCQRIWLVTTNDNLKALRFYQKRGFVLVRVYPEALKVSRKLKPEIPKVGLYGISLRDEIELETQL